ncbi:hypothetical protein PMV_322 [Port-miou virus]|uniref:Uncharacterized protein n=1 Tax=Port-miou virus TaxID=1733873 RepID=A0A0N9Q173_9VIRU|nr:hypothetical protein PMV_322 [Port-miou virus]
MFSYEERKKRRERKQRRKNIGFGLVVFGTAGLAATFLVRERKIDKLCVDVAKRVANLPKADALYTARALTRVPDYPMYFGGIPIGGGPDYDEKSARELHILQTGKTFGTKYKPILFRTDNPKYVTWKDDFPLCKISEDVERVFPDRKRFEVKKNVEPVYYCSKHLVASDQPHVLTRAIASAETGHNKISLIGCASVLGLGIAIFML